MSTFTDVQEDRVINHFFRGSSVTATTGYVGLFTANPGESGGGTECSYSGYARIAGGFSAPSGGATSNAGVLTYAAVAGGAITVTAIGVFDASSGGNLIAYKVLGTGVSYNNGDQPQVNATNLTVTVD
jgi:hypothetical protein